MKDKTHKVFLPYRLCFNFPISGPFWGVLHCKTSWKPLLEILCFNGHRFCHRGPQGVASLGVTWHALVVPPPDP